jgi:hypothetical protein
MNKDWILAHLREAQEEITKMIARIEGAPSVDEMELQAGFEHVYNHLNTAWNSRAASDEQLAACSDEDFYLWRAYPSDISMGL